MDAAGDHPLRFPWAKTIACRLSLRAGVALCDFVTFSGFIILGRKLDRPPLKKRAYPFTEFFCMLSARIAIVCAFRFIVITD